MKNQLLNKNSQITAGNSMLILVRKKNITIKLSQKLFWQFYSNGDTFLSHFANDLRHFGST